MSNSYHTQGEVVSLFMDFAASWVKRFNEALDKGEVDDPDEWTDLPFYGDDDTMAAVAIFIHPGFEALTARVRQELPWDLESRMGVSYLLRNGFVQLREVAHD